MILGTLDSSFMEYFLLETEKVHAKVRRYTSPEEHPFFPDKLPAPILPPLTYPQKKNRSFNLFISFLIYPPVLHPNTVNINARIMDLYINRIVPLITTEGDDRNYGSTATCDVVCLQALSKRCSIIHFVT